MEEGRPKPRTENRAIPVVPGDPHPSANLLCVPTNGTDRPIGTDIFLSVLQGIFKCSLRLQSTALFSAIVKKMCFFFWSASQTCSCCLLFSHLSRHAPSGEWTHGELSINKRQQDQQFSFILTRNYNPKLECGCAGEPKTKPNKTKPNQTTSRIRLNSTIFFLNGNMYGFLLTKLFSHIRYMRFCLVIVDPTSFFLLCARTMAQCS